MISENQNLGLKVCQRLWQLRGDKEQNAEEKKKEKKEQKGLFKRILNPVPSNCGRGRPLSPLGGGEGKGGRRGREASLALPFSLPPL